MFLSCQPDLQAAGGWPVSTIKADAYTLYIYLRLSRLGQMLFFIG